MIAEHLFKIEATMEFRDDFHLVRILINDQFRWNAAIRERPSSKQIAKLTKKALRDYLEGGGRK